MRKERIQTVTGDVLLKMDLPPLRYAVHGFLPQGLHILAGLPKAGKSWLLHQLGLKVSEGENFWNFTTEKGTVLYLCLEDSFTRVQQRLSLLTDSAPDNLHFAIMAPSLSDGLLPQIRQFIADHPDTILVIIDTLQKVRDGTGDNYYASDYKDIGRLKAIADEHALAILCVQHLRKQYDSDPHLMVSGSTGLTGAADGSYVLQKQDVKSPEAKLYVRGRDVEEMVLTIHFNADTCQWEFVCGDTPMSDAMKNDADMTALIEFLKQAREYRGTASALADKLGKSLTGNVLSRKLNRYQKELLSQGVHIDRTRSGIQRELHITMTQ